MNSTAMPGVITPTSSPNTICAASAPARWTRYTAVRTLLAVLAVCLPVALVLVIAAQLTDKNLRMHWPPCLASGDTACTCVALSAGAPRNLERPAGRAKR